MNQVKLLNSILFASIAGIFIYSNNANAASISFTPTGSDIDQDPISDLIVNPHQIISFDINVDTSNINTNLKFSVLIEFSVTLDSDELELIGTPMGTELTENGFRSLEGLFQPIPQGLNNEFLTSFKVKAKHNLPNDGVPDVTLELLGAYIGGVPPTQGAEDVTSSFNPSIQELEVQQESCSCTPPKPDPQGSLPKNPILTALMKPISASASTILSMFEQPAHAQVTDVCPPCPLPEPSSILSLLALGSIGASSTLLHKKKKQKLEKGVNEV